MKLIKIVKGYKTKENMYVYCAKCKNWFFSSKFGKTGILPVECALCRMREYNVPKSRKIKTNGGGIDGSEK